MVYICIKTIWKKRKFIKSKLGGYWYYKYTHQKEKDTKNNLDDDRSFIADSDVSSFEKIDDIAFYPITTRLVRLNVPGSNSKTLNQLLTGQGYNAS